MVAKTSFGQWLKQRRKTLDLTREDLAQRIGCAVVTLNKIEADERRPSKQIAALLAVNLNIPPNEQAAFIQFARTDAAGSSVPWGTPFHPPTNLRASPTLLIGRDDDVAAIRKRLLQPTLRLLTLIGAPGIGKTRLALQSAADVLDDFADGVFFVALAPITDPHLVPTAIMNTLGLPDVGPQTPLERLITFLRGKQTLLVLDNFEQILPAAAQIAELLASCPLLKMLITSRASLRLRTERQMLISPLALPDLAHLPDADTLSHYAAITLFIERAQAVKSEFNLTSDNAPTIAAICTRLDGLPLAIELISARIKLLSPAMLLERLRGRLLLQSDGMSDLEPRHRTLNDAIDWSYQLLTAEEQTLFRRLSVFVGGWTLEAAEAVCRENLTLNILDGLASLLDKNLVKQDTKLDGAPRFMLLETIREYALEQAAAGDETDDLRKHHINYFFKLAEAAEAHFYGREQAGWFDQLEAEWDNLRAALLWSQDSEMGLQLVAALGRFFYFRSHLNEGLDWLKLIVASNPNASAFLRAKALNSSVALAIQLDDWEGAQALCEEALTLARATNDRWNTAWALERLAGFMVHDSNQSAALLEESLRLFREIDDPVGLSYLLHRRAYHALDQKDYSYVSLLLEELTIRARESDDKHTTAGIFYLMGRVAWSRDHDLMQTRTHYERSLLLYREAKVTDEINMSITNLAEIEQAMGNVERSQMLYKEALILHYESVLNHPRIPFILAGLANAAKVHRQFERAARLLGATKSNWSSNWLEQFATLHPEIVPLERDIADLRAQLGEVAFSKAWEEGQAMTIEQVVAYALERNL